ncbi:hypothetical protein Tco_1002469 [Tanacetum coccineum]|uniref:Uncharacterized protein n=1 Tax=Tanacetum coccineum TaxID=301880 RepID=A0ABQ5F6C7_9ASTR
MNPNLMKMEIWEWGDQQCHIKAAFRVESLREETPVRESNIGDSDNTGGDAKIKRWSNRAVWNRNEVHDLLALGSWLLGTLEASINHLLLLGNG